MTTTDIRVAFDRDRQRRRSGLFRRFLRHPGGYIPLGIFVLVVLVGVFAPLLAPMDPNSSTSPPPRRRRPPRTCSAPTRPGATSSAGSSYGTRVTIWGALITIVTVVVIGVLRCRRGYFRGPFDRIAMWVSDALQSIPGTIILLVRRRQPQQLRACSWSRSAWPWCLPRIARSQTMTVREEPHRCGAGVGPPMRGSSPGTSSPPSTRPSSSRRRSPRAWRWACRPGCSSSASETPNVPSWGAMMLEGFRLMLTYPLMLLWPSVALA
jgi:ABC-type dipeptide/oligopeptide/nickel transport system permease subunit